MTRRSKPGAKYPPDWAKIAARVKKEAGNKCVRCGHADEPGWVLTVHHLDLDPSNEHWWNLPALCQRCHLSIQNRVVIERIWMFEHSEWFEPYVAGYYAHKLGICDDRPYVIEHAAEIIARFVPGYPLKAAPASQL